jgi:uncharacterized phage infection (PIP) family protein YhgE
MTSVADIERLKALTDRLLPLSSRNRGEVIAADDWNTVVGALLEVARAVVGDDTGTAVAAHEHPNQVTLGWLDPRLRTLIERGPLSDPTATSRVTAVERQATVIGQRLDEVNTAIRDLRVVTNRHETNDLDRTSSLTVLSRTVSGLKDPRDEVTALRASLDAIATGVSAVSTFAAGLGDVTPAALLNGLDKVDKLQERLTTPTGELIDAAEFERQLTELRTTLVTEDELTEALKDRPGGLTDADRADLLAAAELAAQRQAEDRSTAITEGLRSQLTTRIDEVAQSAVQAARAATGDFRDEVEATITEQLTEVIRQAQAAGEDRLDASVAASRDALQAAVDDRITRLEASLDNRVSVAITEARPELFASLAATVDARIGPLNDRLTALQASVNDARTRIAATATDLAALQQSTTAALERQNTALRAELANEQNRVNVALAELRREIPPRREGITREELNAELARNNDQLRSEITTTMTTRVENQLDRRLSGSLQLVDPRGGGALLQIEPGQRFVLRPVDR